MVLRMYRSRTAKSTCIEMDLICTEVVMHRKCPLLCTESDVTPTKLCDDAQMAIFASFCVLYFRRAACSTYQTCILNSHLGHTVCRSMVDIHSATAEVRQRKKEEERRIKLECGPMPNVMAALPNIGGALCLGDAQYWSAVQ